MEIETTYRALDACVLCVATTRAEGAWCAYIGAVLGYRHDEEWGEVLKDGNKLSESIALAIFPGFHPELPYAG